jgi:hypothetical protein
MGIRLADARLLAPAPVRSVAVLGSLPGWREALQAAGIELLQQEPDLVVAAPELANRAAELGAPSVLVLGARSRALRRAGYLTRTLVVRRGRAGPRLFVPVDAPGAAAHALFQRVPGRSRGKQIAARLVLLALRTGLPLPGAITLGTRKRALPAHLAAAASAGATVGDNWYLLTGEGDDLQRAVWFCFGTTGSRPLWAVKCSRVPGNVAPFDHEEGMLRALEALPAPVRRHAPRFVGRVEADGLPGAVETAAAGLPLQVELRRGGARTTAFVRAIAEWVVELGRTTALPPPALRAELDRLRTEVVRAWTSDGAPPGLAASLGSIPAVLQHNDLGSWNILCDGRTFTVVDWESSRRAACPLWDLVYFLSDALTELARPRDNEAKQRAMLALLRGELPASAFLFERVRDAAAVMSIPRAAVGPVVTLSWLHHGLSATARARRGSAHGVATGGPSTAGPLEQIAGPWLSDPVLGVTWAAFTAATR